MPDAPVSPKKSSARNWISFFIACLIFIIGWSITGHPSGISNLPWWGLFVVLIIQGIILTIWHWNDPKVTADSSETESSLKTEPGPLIISFGGPKTPPVVPPELEPYVRELSAVYQRYGGLHQNHGGTGAHKEARAIGEKINSDHGFKAMQTVCDTLRFRINPTAARELEGTWAYIGSWRI
jgi:hypothetical protein